MDENAFLLSRLQNVLDDWIRPSPMQKVDLWVFHLFICAHHTHRWRSFNGSNSRGWRSWGGKYLLDLCMVVRTLQCVKMAMFYFQGGKIWRADREIDGGKSPLYLWQKLVTKLLILRPTWAFFYLCSWPFPPSNESCTQTTFEIGSLEQDWTSLQCTVWAKNWYCVYMGGPELPWEPLTPPTGPVAQAHQCAFCGVA